MWFNNIKRQKPNEPIEARTLRMTAEAAEWASRIKANSPLTIQATGAGPLLRLAGMLFSVYIAKTSETVSARNGTDPGTGKVILYNFNGTSLAATSTEWTVYNYSGTPTTGIPVGKYCVILKIMGYYWIISVEC
jgi:hypothetical protein